MTRELGSGSTWTDPNVIIVHFGSPYGYPGVVDDQPEPEPEPIAVQEKRKWYKWR